jgi:hypothetical protein
MMILESSRPHQYSLKTKDIIWDLAQFGTVPFSEDAVNRSKGGLI